LPGRSREIFWTFVVIKHLKRKKRTPDNQEFQTWEDQLSPKESIICYIHVVDPRLCHVQTKTCAFNEKDDWGVGFVRFIREFFLKFLFEPSCLLRCFEPQSLLYPWRASHISYLSKTFQMSYHLSFMPFKIFKSPSLRHSWGKGVAKDLERFFRDLSNELSFHHLCHLRFLFVLYLRSREWGIVTPFIK